MTCEEVRRYVSPYLDSELDGKTSFEIARHLELCSSCRARFEAEEAVERNLAFLLRQPEAGDEELWRRALEKAQRRSRFRIGHAMAAAAALILGGVVWWLVSAPPADLAELLRKDYRSAAQQESSLDVPSSDPETVSLFFKERMNMSVAIPPVPQMQLQGGRVCSLKGVPAAFLLYRCGREWVSLCVFSEVHANRFAVTPVHDSPLVDERDAVVVVAVCKAGKVICAVGPVPRNELLALCDAYRRSMSESP